MSGDYREASTFERLATTLAATLAYMAIAKSDAVGLAIFDQALVRYFRPSATSAQWRTVITELQTVPRMNKTGTGRILEQLASKIGRRSLVILLSIVLLLMGRI